MRAHAGFELHPELLPSRGIAPAYGVANYEGGGKRIASRTALPFGGERRKGASKSWDRIEPLMRNYELANREKFVRPTRTQALSLLRLTSGGERESEFDTTSDFESRAHLHTNKSMMKAMMMKRSRNFPDMLITHRVVDLDGSSLLHLRLESVA